MAIGDIQLSPGAMPAEQDDAVASRAPVAAQARSSVLIGEEPTDDIDQVLKEDLADEALSALEVETFMQEIKQQPNWRREADRCVDYYDNNQLSTETVERLQDRGQPPLISNIIKPTIDTVLGMEVKARTDWRVNPEDDEVCSDDLAQALSIKLKHAEIESRADRAVSDAYAGQIKAGLGWVEVGRDHDPFRCPYRVKYVHRREIFWDWRAEQPDLSDARYLIRRRWVDLNTAIAMMPQYASLFRMTTGGWAGFDPVLEQDTRLTQSFERERDTRMESVDWRDIQRKRVCLYEIWYRKWVRGFVLRLPGGRVLEFDRSNQWHVEAVAANYATVEQSVFQKVRLAWYTGPHFLFDLPSPYEHKLFPYVPFFGHREDLTGAPYGLIRPMISPQDEVNARKSKMLWLLNSRRTVADDDAVKDHVKAAEEIARADSYIILDGKRKPSSIFKTEDGGSLANQQFEVMQEAKQEIAEVSGIHKAMQGQQSGAKSGIAMNSLIEQGMTTLAEINDNYRFARRLVGEMLFGMVQQNLSRGPSRVTIGQGAQKKVIQLNQPTVDEQGQRTILNNVAAVRAKVVLDDVPSTPTYRLQMLQMLTEVTKGLPPQLQAAVIDFVIEATDLPNRHEIADRLRAVAGIKTPEEQQQMAQAQAAQQQRQSQQAEQLFVLEAADKTADIRLKNAKADVELQKANEPITPPTPMLQGAAQTQPQQMQQESV